MSAGATHEEDAVHHPPVVHPFWAPVPFRKHQAEDFPHRIARVMSVVAHASNSLWKAVAKERQMMRKDNIRVHGLGRAFVTCTVRLPPSGVNKIIDKIGNTSHPFSTQLRRKN